MLPVLLAFHALTLPQLASVRPLPAAAAVASRRWPLTMSSVSEKSPDKMRMSELKAELDSRNVEWRGTCFEKEELVARL
eukprot:5909561-Prymnesium_polylepis.1